MRRRIRKYRRGSDHPAAVLDAASVAELRDMRRDGASYRELAEDFGVSLPTVWKAAIGISWQCILAEPAERVRTPQYLASGRGPRMPTEPG